MRFKYSTSFDVRFRDCDPLGHVNNAVYLTYLEVARFAYWRDVADARIDGGAGFIMARAEIDYRAPAVQGDVLTVSIGITGFGRSSFVFEYDITDQNGRAIAAARTVQVMYDYAANRSVPVDETFKRKISDYEGLGTGE